jgi:hypothetical protein
MKGNYLAEENAKSLIRFNKLLFSIYKRVYNLEVDGTKQLDIKKYEKELKLLTMTLKNINDYCYSLSSNINNIVEMREYITNLASNPSQIEMMNFEKTMSQKDINSIIIRCILYIDNIINQYTNKHYDISKEISDTYKNRVMDVYDYVDAEILKNYLIIIQKYIDNGLGSVGEILNINVIDTKKLIKVKYDNAFLNFEIEKYMAGNNFEVSNLLFKDSKSKLDEIDIDNNTYNKIKNERIIKTAITKIKKILSNKNNLEGEENTLGILYDYCYLRSLLVMTDEEVVADINDWFHNYVTSSAYAKNFNSNIINEKLVIEAFKNVNKDKNVYQKFIMEKSK